MPVQQNSYTHLRVLLVLNDSGILAHTTIVIIVILTGVILWLLYYCEL
jgi:hypothetical protein